MRLRLKEIFGLISKIAEDNKLSTPYICGGTPRDKYMGKLKNVADIDLTTGDATIKFLAAKTSLYLSKKFYVELEQMHDGHATMKIGNIKIDFSSNYITPNIDGYLSERGITSPTSLQKEMFSRDFTCNSLLLSLDLKSLKDPTQQGITDINKKIIKTCLPPEVTLTSFKNRIPRIIYLACKLGFEVDPTIIKFVANNPKIIKNSTLNSINSKLGKAFEINPEKAARLMNEMNLWSETPMTNNIYSYYLKYKGVVK